MSVKNAADRAENDCSIGGILIFPFLTKEEQGNRSRTSVAADRSTDRINLYLAIKLWKFSFNEISNSSGIIHALRLADKAFAGIVSAIIGVFPHQINDPSDHLFLGTDLFSWDQLTFIANI